MRKKQCVAMLLAGGQGSRLGILTKDVAKPAVPYGGKYRIIDFPLSNCTNSGIDVVGVLTQYRPLELNAYIGSGSPWDLDLSNGGVYVLPPYQTGKTGEWYKGTANAIYQNIPFIAQWDPEYVLVLSGDHIYKKPAQPKSNKASMGVYIFSWSKMRKYLELDEANPNSDNDFGKNIIPAMLEAGENLYTYTFDGYWKDVGTIESLWEANMDLLEMPMPIDLYDKRWRIYARNPGMPPHYIADGAKVVNCLITEGCEVKGVINHSVLFAGVTVETGAEITDAVIMPGAVIERGAVVRRAIVAENAHIGAGAVVGEETGKIAVVGHNAVIPAGDKVAAGVQVDASAQQ